MIPDQGDHIVLLSHHTHSVVRRWAPASGCEFISGPAEGTVAKTLWQLEKFPVGRFVSDRGQMGGAAHGGSVRLLIEKRLH